jgi:hypothetical protein
MEYDIGKLDEYDRLRSGINACIGGNEPGQEARRKHVLMLAVELAAAAFVRGEWGEPRNPPEDDTDARLIAVLAPFEPVGKLPKT